MATEQEIRQWYNTWVTERGEDAWRPARAYPVFLDLLEVQQGKRLLDVACGVGHLLSAAQERGLMAYGVDISDKSVEIARRVSPKSKIQVGRGEALPFSDSTFDYLTCLGALEHFLDMERGLREMVRVTKQQARLCVVVPNSGCLYWKFTGSKGTSQQDINEHLLSLEEWTALFAKAGLEVETVRHDTWLMDRIRIFDSFNPLRVLRNAVLKSSRLFLPVRHTYQFIFLLKKSEPRQS